MRQFRINKEVIIMGAVLAVTFIVFVAQGGFTPNMPAAERYSLTAVMIIAAIVAIVASAKKPKAEKVAIIAQRVRERKRYLPQLKQAIDDYINRMDLLTQNKSLYIPERYTASVPTRSFKWTWLWVDNHIYKRLQRNDEELDKIRRTIDSYSTRVKDKKVRNFALGLPRASHHAYSYVIYTNLVGALWEKLPFVVRALCWLGRKMQTRFRRHQHETNDRIDELLEGEPDDM
jgi:hypothetical protein